MKKINSNLECPSCSKNLQPKIMRCDDCDLEVTAHFERSEFFHLNNEDLHFVRLFVHCEGRIRDLEKALGVSYPTVKAKIAQIKNKLSLSKTDSHPTQKLSETKPPQKPNPAVIIDQLKSGKIDFETAIQILNS